MVKSSATGLTPVCRIRRESVSQQPACGLLPAPGSVILPTSATVYPDPSQDRHLGSATQALLPQPARRGELGRALGMVNSAALPRLSFSAAMR
jgi:hypothetical protein